MNELSTLTSEEAREVLAIMLRRDKTLAKNLRAAIDELKPAVDSLEVAGSVQFDLELLSMDDLAARSGRHLYGYTDPAQAASDMLEGTIETHTDAAADYMKLSRPRDAIRYHLGILKGIYDFDTESESEVKDYLMDATEEMFVYLLQTLNTDHPDAIDSELRGFLLEQCPEWQEAVHRTLS